MMLSHAPSARRIGALAAHLPPAPAAAAAATASQAPTMYLNTGAAMPVIGLGTFQATEPGEVLTAVKAAVNAGYRLIDCAAGYGNQVEVGQAIKELIAEGVVKRDELFVRPLKNCPTAAFLDRARETSPIMFLQPFDSAVSRARRLRRWSASSFRRITRGRGTPLAAPPRWNRRSRSCSSTT
jgi:hypothetical protein